MKTTPQPAAIYSKGPVKPVDISLLGGNALVPNNSSTYDTI